MHHDKLASDDRRATHQTYSLFRIALYRCVRRPTLTLTPLDQSVIPRTPRSRSVVHNVPPRTGCRWQIGARPGHALPETDQNTSYELPEGW